MLQPTPVKRVQFYSRNPHTSYVDWLLSQNGITSYKQEWYDELVNQSIRSSVDDIVMERIKNTHIDVVTEETPSWVSAALITFKDTAGDILEVIEETFEDILDEDESPIGEGETQQDRIEEDTEEEKEIEVDENEDESNEQNQDEDVEEEIEETAEEATEEETVEEDTIEEPIVYERDNPFAGEPDYNSYTVRELQELCKKRGITIRGTKSEVVLRLRRDDEGIVDQPTEGEIEAPSQEAADIEPDAPSQEAATEEVTQHDDSRQEQPDNEEE